MTTAQLLPGWLRLREASGVSGVPRGAARAAKAAETQAKAETRQCGGKLQRTATATGCWAINLLWPRLSPACLKTGTNTFALAPCMWSQHVAAAGVVASAKWAGWMWCLSGGGRGRTLATASEGVGELPVYPKLSVYRVTRHCMPCGGFESRAQPSIKGSVSETLFSIGL